MQTQDYIFIYVLVLENWIVFMYEAELKHLINVHCLNLAFINYTVIILLLNFSYLPSVKCQVTKGGWTPRATLYITALKARWQPLKTISLAVLVLPSTLKGFVYSLASCVPTPSPLHSKLLVQFSLSQILKKNV